MTILILYAGGTIGMKPTVTGYQPMEEFETLLHSQLSSRPDAQLPKYELVSFKELIDSSDLMPSDWTKTGRALVDNWDKYDGFVLLHGTDTMAYTASMLSFMLQCCNKPVIVTGSQIPMSETRSDALNNLIGSLVLAASQSIKEVCIYFNNRLIRGNRATKVSSKNLTAFDSPNFPHLGTLGIKIEIQKHLLLPDRSPAFLIPNFDRSTVAVAYIYPGIQGSSLEFLLGSASLRGVVLCTYGSGNPPAANQSLMKVLEQIADKGTCIVNITQCQEGGVTQGAYATGSALGNIGVISGHDLTLEAALTKLYYLIATNPDNGAVKKLMATSLCGENTIPH